MVFQKSRLYVIFLSYFLNKLQNKIIFKFMSIYYENGRSLIIRTHQSRDYLMLIIIKKFIE